MMRRMAMVSMARIQNSSPATETAIDESVTTSMSRGLPSPSSAGQSGGNMTLANSTATCVHKRMEMMVVSLARWAMV